MIILTLQTDRWSWRRDDLRSWCRDCTAKRLPTWMVYEMYRLVLSLFKFRSLSKPSSECFFSKTKTSELAGAGLSFCLILFLHIYPSVWFCFCIHDVQKDMCGGLAWFCFLKKTFSNTKFTYEISRDFFGCEFWWCRDFAWKQIEPAPFYGKSIETPIFEISSFPFEQWYM